MKRLVLASALTLVLFQPAFAEEDCDKSWNLYDVNKDGHISGDEATRFRDDMRARGVTVGSTRSGNISAGQYNKACINNFWSKMEELGP